MAEYDLFSPYYDLEYGHKDNDLDFLLGIVELTPYNELS